MKNQLLKSALFIAIIASLTSCGRDREAIKNAISEQQIAYLVEGALQEAQAGLTEQIATMVAIAEEAVVSQCGVTIDSTVTYEQETLIGSAEYVTEYTWTLICQDDVVPLNYDFESHMEGQYNNNRMTSNDYGDATWELTGLNESVSEFTANGTYGRNGEQTFKTEGIVTESNMDMFVTNLKIDKTTEEIMEGTAEVNVHGSTDSDESFDFEGEIVFKGNGKATLTVNGKTFQLSL